MHINMIILMKQPNPWKPQTTKQKDKQITWMALYLLKSWINIWNPPKKFKTSLKCLRKYFSFLRLLRIETECVQMVWVRLWFLSPRFCLMLSLYQLIRLLSITSWYSGLHWPVCKCGSIRTALEAYVTVMCMFSNVLLNSICQYFLAEDAILNLTISLLTVRMTSLSTYTVSPNQCNETIKRNKYIHQKRTNKTVFNHRWHDS